MSVIEFEVRRGLETPVKSRNTARREAALRASGKRFTLDLTREHEMKELRFKLAAAELVLGRAGYAASARAAQAVLDRYADDPHSVSDDVARAAATVSYAAAVGVTA